MKQILKRLELIKTAIDINNEEIIEIQILKLKKLEIGQNMGSFFGRIIENR